MKLASRLAARTLVVWLETTMAAWADACHAQGGTVILPHLPNPNGEPAALIATGRVDGVEMIRDGVYQHLEYYRYLNAGYRLLRFTAADVLSDPDSVVLLVAHDLPPVRGLNDPRLDNRNLSQSPSTSEQRGSVGRVRNGLEYHASRVHEGDLRTRQRP